MTSEISSRAACLAELTSNPKSFSNCPDLHGGVPGLHRKKPYSVRASNVAPVITGIFRSIDLPYQPVADKPDDEALRNWESEGGAMPASSRPTPS